VDDGGDAELPLPQLTARQIDAMLVFEFDDDDDDGFEAAVLAAFDRQSHGGGMHFAVAARDAESQRVVVRPDHVGIILGDAVAIRTDQPMRLRHDETGKVHDPTRAGNGALIFALTEIGHYTLVLAPPLMSYARFTSSPNFGAGSSPTGGTGVAGADNGDDDDDPPAFTVTVVKPRGHLRVNVAKLGAAALLGVVLAGFIVLGIALGAGSSSLFRYLLSNVSIPNLAGFETKLEDLFYHWAFPWLVTAAVVLFMVLVARVALCFRVERVHHFRRGYGERAHLIGRWLVALQGLMLVVLVLIAWHFALCSNIGFSNFLSSMSTSAMTTLNLALSIGNSAQGLIQQLPLAFPGITLPSGAQGYIDETLTIVHEARTWSRDGVQLAAGLFRILAVVRFVVLSLSLFAAAAGMIGAYFASADLIRSAVWFNGIALATLLISTGVSSLIYGIGQQCYEVGQVLETRSATTSTLTTDLGLSNSIVLQLIVQCDESNIISQDFLNAMCLTIITEWNNSTIPAFWLPTDFSLANASSTKQTILRLIDRIQYIEDSLLVSSSGLGAAGRFINQTAPLLNAALTVTRTTAELSDCAFLQDALGRAMPTLEDDALAPLKTHVNVCIVIVVTLFFGLIFNTLASFVLRRPLKVWYYKTTERWFRYRYSWRVHKRVTLRLSRNKLRQKQMSGNPRVHQPSWLTATSALIFGYLAHHVCSLVEFFVGMMLLILNFSLASNELPAPLLASACIAFIPAIVIPLEFKCSEKLPAVPPVILRLLSTATAITTTALTYHYSHTANELSNACLGKLMESGDDSDANAEVVNPCSPDAVFRNMETSIYAVVVGTISCLAMVSGIVLVYNSSRRVWVSTYRSRSHRPKTISGSKRRRSAESDPTEAEGAVTHIAMDDIHKRNAVESMAAFDRDAVDDLKAAADVRRRLPCGFTRRQVRVAVVITVLTVAIVVPIIVAASLAKPVNNTAGVAWTLPAGGCNGADAFCSKRVDELVWATVHDAMASAFGGFIAPSNVFPLSTALASGYRAATLQVMRGLNTAAVYECLASCFLGGYPFVNDLNVLGNFLDAHPSEVVIIFLTQTCFTEDLSASMQASSASHLLWTPSDADRRARKWPRLQDLIVANQRLLLFTDAAPNGFLNDLPPPWLQYTFDWLAATSTAARQVSDLTCMPGTGFITANSTGGKKILLNHFVDAPFASASSAATANQDVSIEKDFESCVTFTGVAPTFVSVDFWSLGNVLSYAYAKNMVG
jgi:hypothetical protein